MIIKRIGPVSCAKISATLYAIIGLFVGACFSIASLFGVFAAKSAGDSLISLVIGVGSIVVLPIFYGCLGFVFTLIGAWLYNVLAAMVGGVQIDVE